MHQLTAVLLLIALFTSDIPVQQPEEIKKMPPVNWARTHNTDIKHIAIDLRFDWKKKQAYGTTAVMFSLFNSDNKITLDAAMLTVNSVKLLNGTALAFKYDGGDKNDALEIMLDKMYKPGTDITVKIEYHTNWVNESEPNNIWGSSGKGIRFFEPTSTEPKRRKQIWSAGEPEGNRYWFPCYDAPNDLHTTAFTATVENNFTVVSNGKLVTTKSNKDGTKTFHWEMDKPMDSYKTSFVIGEYVDVQQKYGDIQLHSIGYPDEKDAVTATVERLPDMMKFFSDVTGVKYPYQNYSQVFVQEVPNWLGNAATSTITENMVDDYRTHADFFYLWDLTEAEALASQWFGSYISCSNWSDIWLNKAFSRYFSGLYDEYKNGKDEFLLYQHLYDINTIYLGDWNAGVRHPLVTKQYENAAAFVSDNYAYSHGATVLHMLRKQLGEEKWRKAIQLYVKSNAHKSVSTEDFRRAVEEATGEPMDWFFDQWVYKMGHPVFDVTKNYDEAKKQLSLTVKQSQKKDSTDEYPQAEFFKGKVDIEIDGKIEKVWIEPTLENTFTFNTVEKPLLVNFDYESGWVKEITFNKPLDELLFQLQNDKDITGRQWAAGELIAVAQNEKTTAEDKAKIYAGFRNVISGNAYWRFRVSALAQLRGLYGSPASAAPVELDETTIAMLLNIIKNEKAWLRTAAITFLGMTRDVKYADLYAGYLNDSSERVINAAAIALGKTKGPKAFAALAKLKDKPSWKNQSLISTLNGLKELGDAKGFDIAIKALADSKSPHWTLATPVWDHRLAAAQTLVALGKADKAYPVVLEQFKKAMRENNINDIFYNALQTATLADPRGQEVFNMLKEKYKDDASAMTAVTMYETQLNDNIKAGKK